MESASTMDKRSIDTLDDDCLLKVFSYLPVSCLMQAQKVCRRWEILCQKSWRAVQYFYSEGRNWYFMKKHDNLKYKVRNINDLKVILQYCGEFIKFYHLSGTRGQLNDTTLTNLLTTVIEQCKNVKEIYFKLTNPSIPIDSLLNNYQYLEKLTLVEIQANMQETISTSLQQYKQLKSFSLHLLNYQSDSNKVDGKFLEYLPDNLEELNFTQCDSVELNYVIVAVEKCRSLITLSYNSSHWPRDAIMKVIGKKQTLINLSLKSLSIKPSLYNNLANLTNLQILNLEFNSNLQDESLVKIANNCKLLKSLNISHCYQLTNYGIAQISRLTNLEELKMINMKDVTDEPIGNFPSTLRYLSCSACWKVENDGLIKLLHKATNITKLNVSECFNVTGHLIEVAIEIMETRANNILSIYVCCSRSGMYACDLKKLYGDNVTTMWPYLKILYSIRSDCNKRTECNFRYK